jgi:D-sedoheptulose 7-phosphate isomerase
MSMLEQRIQQQFFESADLKYQSAEGLARPVTDAAAAVLGCITAGGKVLVLGVGRAASQAQQLAAALVGRFERERLPLAALALGAESTLVAALCETDGVTAAATRQLLALGQPADVLVVLDASGRSPQALSAVDAARSKDMTVVALTGCGHDTLARHLQETDVHVCVPHEHPARVQEVHQLVLHCLCDAVDLQLLGEQESP